MGIYDRAIFVALVIVALAVLMALLPEISERLPRRRRRREEHRVRAAEGEPAPPPSPKLKRGAQREEPESPPDADA